MGKEVILKKGDFVKTDYTECSYITAGKEYEVFEFSNNTAMIKDNRGIEVWINVNKPSVHLHYIGVFTKTKKDPIQKLKTQIREADLTIDKLAKAVYEVVKEDYGEHNSSLLVAFLIEDIMKHDSPKMRLTAIYGESKKIHSVWLNPQEAQNRANYLNQVEKVKVPYYVDKVEVR